MLQLDPLTCLDHEGTYFGTGLHYNNEVQLEDNLPTCSFFDVLMTNSIVHDIAAQWYPIKMMSFFLRKKSSFAVPFD